MLIPTTPLRIEFINQTRAQIINVTHSEEFVDQLRDDRPRSFFGRSEPTFCFKNTKIKPGESFSMVVQVKKDKSQVLNSVGYQVFLKFLMWWPKTLEEKEDDLELEVKIVDADGKFCNETYKDKYRYKVEVSFAVVKDEKDPKIKTDTLTIKLTQSKDQKIANTALLLLGSAQLKKRSTPEIALHACIAAYHKLKRILGRLPKNHKAEECVFYNVIEELADIYPFVIRKNIEDYLKAINNLMDKEDVEAAEKKCLHRLKGMDGIKEKDSDMTKEHSQLETLFKAITDLYKAYKKNTMAQARETALVAKVSDDTANFKKAASDADQYITEITIPESLTVTGEVKKDLKSLDTFKKTITDCITNCKEDKKNWDDLVKSKLK